MKRIFFIIIISISSFANSFSQDIEFSQFSVNGLYYNPAFTGAAYTHRFNATYRNQLPNFNSPYVTCLLSYDNFVNSLNSGFGFMIIQDNLANSTLNTTSIKGLYSYNIDFSQFLSIKFGLQAQYDTQTLHWNKLTFAEQLEARKGIVKGFDHTTTPIADGKDKWDFGVGLLGVYRTFHLGISYDHIATPADGLHKNLKTYLKSKFTIQGGAKFTIGRYRSYDLETAFLVINPTFLYQKQDDFNQINMGVKASLRGMIGGINVRHNVNFDYDSFIAMLGYRVNGLRFIYSFDLTISKLINSFSGAHELTLSYIIPKGKKYKKSSNYFVF